MTLLRWTTAGESHGKALLGILEGLPYGLAVDVAAIDAQLARRQAGFGRSGRMKIEHDRAQILSGWRGGVSLGSPLALSIENRDATLESLPDPSAPRPGHADLAGCQKLGVRDARAVLERASARETAMRVALGAVARQLLECFGIEIFAHVVQVGARAADPAAIERCGLQRAQVRNASAFAGLDPQADLDWRDLVEAARASGDTLGGVFEVRAFGVPPGLGGYADPSERLHARVGAALLSIPAIKGVEFGLGFEAARWPGSAVHDAIETHASDRAAPFGRFTRRTNRAGGFEGGMTNGETLLARAAMKPISTLRRGLDSVDFASGAPSPASYQRSDVLSVPAASVVGEAMMALELARAMCLKFGSDSLDQMRAGWDAYLSQLQAL